MAHEGRVVASQGYDLGGRGNRNDKLLLFQWYGSRKHQNYLVLGSTMAFYSILAANQAYHDSPHGHGLNPPPKRLTSWTPLTHLGDMRQVKFYASSQPLPYDHSALCCCTSSSIKTTLHHQQNLHNDSLSLSELFVLLQYHPQATTINTLQKARFSHIVMPAGMMLNPFPCN